MVTQALKHELKDILEKHVGRANAIKVEDLIRRFKLSDDRPVRRTVEDLIDEGLPVCSVTKDPSGYFIPQDLAEARLHGITFRKTAASLFVRQRRIINNTKRYYSREKQLVLI